MILTRERPKAGFRYGKWAMRGRQRDGARNEVR